MMFRLLYTSRNAIFAQGGRALVHFHDIVRTARRQNGAMNVTGFLWFDRRRYFQILEGHPDRVEALFARISRDRRHRDINLMDWGPIEARLFGEWSMAAHLHDTLSHPVLDRHAITHPDELFVLPPERLTAFAAEFSRYEPPDDGQD